MAESDSTLHKDHRARLRKRYEREGLQSFEDHNVLELLLFYVIPRRDTNPIAHRLLARFGSLSAVFEATEKELCEVEGIGPSAAAFLKLCPEISRRVIAQRLEKSAFVTDSILGPYFVNYFRFDPPETACIMFLDRDMSFVSVELLSYGVTNCPDCVLTRALEAAAGCGGRYAVIAHNHGNVGTAPTKQDIAVTGELRGALAAHGVQLVAHYIVSGFDYENIMERKGANEEDI